jgi:lipoate-protein ligase A
MAVVHASVQERVAPGVALALDGRALARVRAGDEPSLRIHAWAGDVLLLGRYHPDPAGCAGVTVQRRLSGGRVFPAGAGFVAFALALAHRSALESSEPHALRAEQTLNRAVRGLLEALKLLGLDAYYPGRDLVTVGGKPIAWLSLAVEDEGATLVEGALAVDRDLSLLPELADRADPAGIVPVTLWLPDVVTSLARELGDRTVPVREVASALLQGFRRRLGLGVVEDDPPPAPSLAADEVAFALPPDLDRAGRRSVMLGTLVAHWRGTSDGTLGAVRLCGDLIAPVATVAAVEAALAGAAVAREALVERVASVLAHPEHFLLGVTAADVAEAVLAGAP